MTKKTKEEYIQKVIDVISKGDRLCRNNLIREMMDIFSFQEMMNITMDAMIQMNKSEKKDEPQTNSR